MSGIGIGLRLMSMEITPSRVLPFVLQIDSLKPRRPICIASRTHLKALHPNGLAYLARMARWVPAMLQSWALCGWEAMVGMHPWELLREVGNWRRTSGH